MKEKYRKYLLSYGIDLSDLSHPLSLEIALIIKLNKPHFTKSIEHLIMLLIIDLEGIKKYNIDDFKHYLTKLKKKDISFWGERFEIYFYYRLITRLNTTIKNVKRGIQGIEADFIVNYNGYNISIETTSLNFTKDSFKKNPISKLKSKISQKESNKYSNLNCCLIIDITNLSFYRYIYNNFSVTILELFKSIKSEFGAILLHESFHIIDKENLTYKSQIYDWLNPNIDTELKDFISKIIGPREYTEGERLYLKAI